MKKVKARVRLGRYMNSNTLFLKVEDEASGAEFLDLEFDAEQLANLMNQSCAYMEGEARGLEFVGKKRVSEAMEITLPPGLSRYDKKEIAEYLVGVKQVFEGENPGWYLDTYIGSQQSIYEKDDVAIARLRRYTYVEEK